MTDNDLFEDISVLPIEVQRILEANANMDETYENCEKLISQLKTVGYTCDYGLDAIPYHLKKLEP